ncbi:hypothetical protein ACFLZZ_04750 [Nanoarchaeota archaeon]
MKDKFLKALNKLKESAEKRGFKQSVDLIINLSDIDLRKTPINLFFSFPNQIKVPKICAFLNNRSPSVDRSVTKVEINALDKKAIKRISEDYDFFLASGPLMGLVATVFGKSLGPLGKMPNPKYGGVIMVEEEANIKKAVDKFKKAAGIRAKQPSIKISIGKEDMENEKLAENAETVYHALVAALPKNKDNVKSIMVKLTMSKPEKLEL